MSLCGGAMTRDGSVHGSLIYKSIYEDPETTVSLMKKYHATLLYVGDAERERYKVHIPLIWPGRNLFCPGNPNLSTFVTECT